MGFRGSVGQIDGGHVVYADAHLGTDVVRTSTPGALHESLLLSETSPHVFGWQVGLGAGIKSVVTQGHGTLVFLDEAGVAHLHVPVPFVVDADGKEQKAEANFADGILSMTWRLQYLKLPAIIHWSVNLGGPPDGGGSGGVVFPQVKPRIMVLVDSSGSMTSVFASNADTAGDGNAALLYTDAAVTNQNHYPGNPIGGSRMFAAKQALTNAVSAAAPPTSD